MATMRLWMQAIFVSCGRVSESIEVLLDPGVFWSGMHCWWGNHLD